MNRKYVCSKCYEEFLAIEDIVNHLKNAHPEVEDIDSYIDIIDLESREWTDFEQRRIRLEPIKTEPSVPKEYLPEGFVRIEDYPSYYYKDNRYFCSEHNKTFDTENEFLMHILAEHPKHFNGILRFVVKRSLLKKELERATEKELKNTIDKEVHQWFMKAEQQRPEALNAYVEDFFDRLLNFLKGDDDICPICNRLYTIQNQLHLDKIFQCLRKGIELQGGKLYQTLKAWEKQGKPWEFWKVCKYLCKWDNKEVWLSLYPLLHVFQDHKGTFERLVKNGILQGTKPKDESIIDFLYEKKYLKKTQTVPMLKAEEPKEQLSKGIIIKKKENLSEGEQALIEWLKKGTVSKE